MLVKPKDNANNLPYRIWSVYRPRLSWILVRSRPSPREINVFPSHEAARLAAANQKAENRQGLLRRRAISEEYSTSLQLKLNFFGNSGLLARRC